MRGLIAAALILAALPAAADEAKITVTKEVWAGFEEYKAAVTSTDAGFFAVSKSGGAWGWAKCGTGECETQSVARQAAIERCEKYAGVKGACVIFARNAEIEVPYEVGR